MNYSLNCTYDCNWTCSYCIVETHEQPKRTLGMVLDSLKEIPRGSNVSLGGGEPGLMNEEDIQLIIWYLNGKECNIDLLTNGLFLKRFGDNKSIMSNIDTIHYHCVQDLSDEIEFPTWNGKNIDYQIVINDLNFDGLDEFLDKYPDLTFSIVPAKNIETLDKKKAFDIIKKYRHRMSERSITEFFQDACENVKYIG